MENSVDLISKALNIEGYLGGYEKFKKIMSRKPVYCTPEIWKAYSDGDIVGAQRLILEQLQGEFQNAC